MRYLLLGLKRFCGFVAGFVFFLSGIVKLMDPVGAGLVMEEYYAFLHVEFMDFSAKVIGTLFALAETLIGAALITGVWRRITGQIAIAMQAFFTLLTAALVIFNPEMDCGCFGEAIHLTHMQTFLKNIVLMALLLLYYIPGRHLGQAPKKKFVSFAIVGASTLAFTIYSWITIPMMDFTAYKPGAELVSSTETDTDEMYKAVFIYEKDGITKAFTLEDLPDSTWTFINTETIIQTDADEASVELSFYSMTSGAYCDSLAHKGQVMVVSVYDTDMKAGEWRKIEDFARRSETAGFMTLVLCSTESGVPEEIVNKAYISDYKTLISLNRSNGGVTYFKDGILIRKWAEINSPDTEELDEVFRADATEISIARDSKGSLGLQGFLLYVFTVMLLL